MYQNRNFFIDNLQRDIYPIVAKLITKTIKQINIKCTLIMQQKQMYYKCEARFLKEYFSFTMTGNQRQRQ